jgi:hypothetical protein
MPVLLAEQIVSIEFADLLTRTPIVRPARPPVRAEGAHQSDILAHVAQKVGWLDPGERPEEDMPIIWCVGCAWEEWAASLYPDMEWQPGELTADGISGNADGLTADPLQIEEFKASYKSCGSLNPDTPPPPDYFLKEKKFQMWQHQGRAYCYLYGPRVVRWHVLHIRSDYKTFGPTYKQYIVEFTDAEVEQTWSMLVRFRDEAMAAREGVLTA